MTETSILGFMLLLFAIPSSLVGIMITLIVATTGGFDKLRKQLERCVVHGQCNKKDSQLHIEMERMLLRLDKKFGTTGLVFGLWFVASLDTYPSIIRNLISQLKGLPN